MDRRFTSLGRPIDLNLKTNSMILYLTAGAFILAAFFYVFVENVNILKAVSNSLTFAIGFFLSWAVGREVDPDHDASAFIALPAYAAYWYFSGKADIIELFFMLMVIRMVNRTTGLKPTVLDSVLILVLGILLSYFNNWLISVMLTTAFFIDARLHDGKPSHRFYGALFLFFILFAYLFNSSGYVKLQIHDTLFITTLIITLMYALTVLTTVNLKSMADNYSGKILSARVRSAQIILGFYALASFMWYGGSSFADLSAVWAAMTGAGLNTLWRLLSPGNRLKD